VCACLILALVKLKPLEEETPSYCTVCLPERDHEDHGGEECLVAGYSHPTGTTGGGPSTPQGNARLEKLFLFSIEHFSVILVLSFSEMLI